MSCVTGIQPQLMEAMVCYLDDIISYICTPSVCMCVTASMCMYVHADVDLCACVRACAGICIFIIKKTEDRRAETDVVVYEKKTHTQKKTLVNNRQSKCRNKERGPTKRNRMKNCLTEAG